MFKQMMFQMFYEAPENALLSSFDLHCASIEASGGLNLYKQVNHYVMVTEALYHRGLMPNWKPMYVPS
jgi:hypothetical protein